jgi:hypothetical protein
VASAFGQTETAAAIEAYAPASVSSQFKTLPIQNAAEPSPRVRAFFQGQGPTLDAPNTDMTPTEIYLEFRSSPVGGLGIASSLYEAGVYMAKALTAAGTFGYAVGTGINYLITNYDPPLEDAIGGTVSGMLEQAQQAATDIKAGKLEQAVDALFGTPIAYENSADFDVNQDSVDYFEASGGC